MPDAVLSLNAGSSSIKFALFEIDTADPRRVAHGQIEKIGEAPHFIAFSATGVTLADRLWPAAPRFADLLDVLLDWVTHHLGADRLVAVGHRVVHGGRTFDRAVRTDDAVLQALDRLTPLAPLHQPHNLAPIRAIASLRPGLPQVACFDTSFHHGLAPVVTRFALPREYEDAGIRRYGFHGLSYEFIARRLRMLNPALAAGRVIAAHLGNGASLCAMQDGRSVDTTMGFTALDGLMMGTRCGTIDPGVILHLERQMGMRPADVEEMLYHRAGLLGVSGIASDMRTLLASPDPRAREALELFVFRIAREAGALISTLGGLDALVFTAGIGEHAPEIRSAVATRLAWLDLSLDAEANIGGIGRISHASSRVAVLVVPTDEEAMIAHHTLDVVGVSG